jgi:pimeloyl-ACP methyl ester carboxylesterase
MAHFILIHGASHGGWCWEKVVPLLKQHGHTVVTPDMPGGGADQTPTHKIDLPLYAKRVIDLIDAAPSKPVLVGHSMGGISITEAAEARSDKIACLVFLCALMPVNGQYAREITAREPGSLVARSLEMSNDGLTYTYKKSNIPTLFYNDCTPEDIFRATERLRPMPRAIAMTAVHHSPEHYGKVKRVYIECTRDQAITIELQRYMVKTLPPNKVIAMETGHSPFISAPEALAKNFEDIATWAGA